jgi:hypothetical protein
MTIFADYGGRFVTTAGGGERPGGAPPQRHPAR